MQKIYVRANRNSQIERVLSYKNEAVTYQVDYSAWAEENGTLSTVTATVKSGDAAISSESLASDVKTMLVTTDDTGGSMIKLTATDGTDIHALYIYIFTKDPQAIVSDYGFRSIL